MVQEVLPSLNVLNHLQFFLIINKHIIILCIIPDFLNKITKHLITYQVFTGFLRFKYLENFHKPIF